MVQDQKEYHKQWAKKNRKKLNAYSNKYYHEKKLKEYSKEWYHRNHDENRRKRRENNKKRRKEILAFLGDKCKRCGYDEDYRALQIDHVNGDGGKDRKKYGHSASALKRDVHSHPEKYQLLCANCNWIKRDEQKEQYKEK